MEEASASGEEVDLYTFLKTLMDEAEFIDIRIECVKEELKRGELIRAQEELKQIQSCRLHIGQLREMIYRGRGIVNIGTGTNRYVRILSTINGKLLKPSNPVALRFVSRPVVDVLPANSDLKFSKIPSSMSLCHYVFLTERSIFPLLLPCLLHRKRGTFSLLYFHIFKSANELFFYLLCGCDYM